MLRRILALALLTSTAACVAGPYNDTEVPSTTQAITIRGYWPSPSYSVRIMASASPSGPFVQIGTAVTQTNGYTYPDGLTMYFFTTDVVVPTQYWSGDGCSGSQTFLRVQNVSGITAFSLDEIAPTGETAFACIQNRVNAGWSTINAFSYCDSPDSPNIRLFTSSSSLPTNHTGNITIANNADEAQWACLETLQGNLTITQLGPDDVSLPHLQQVTGDVSVVYDRFSLGGSLQGSYQFFAPQLTTITGDLVATSPLPPSSPPGPIGSVIIGLDALTSLQGDLRVQVDAFNINLNGLDGLTTIGGDLILDGGTGDATLGNFVPNLVQVNGDVEVDIGNNIFEMFVGLQTVQGELRHLNGNTAATSAPNNPYENLQQVGGRLVFESAMVQGPGGFPIFPSLTSVGQAFEYRQVGGVSSIFAGATGGLTVGGLVVDGNPALTTVGASNVQVSGAGNIQVVGNPNLCVSSINAFVAGQTGWTGTLTQSGNDTGC